MAKVTPAGGLSRWCPEACGPIASHSLCEGQPRKRHLPFIPHCLPRCGQLSPAHQPRAETRTSREVNHTTFAPPYDSYPAHAKEARPPLGSALPATSSAPPYTNLTLPIRLEEHFKIGSRAQETGHQHHGAVQVTDQPLGCRRHSPRVHCRQK